MSEIEETAKATQEVAKTVSNALDKSEKFGGFITKYFGTTMEQSIGIFNDKLKYWRWENQVNLISKANQKMEKLGIDTPRKQIPLKLGLPLIEAASLEDDNQLQELWANLLVNSSTVFSLERSYISVLEQLSSLEANILMTIYSSISFDDKNIYNIYTIDLPNTIDYTIRSICEANDELKNILDFTLDEPVETKVLDLKKPDIPKTPAEPEEIVRLALSNLTRLQCLIPELKITGAEQFAIVSPTIFGAKLYEAVKEPTN